MVLKKLVFFHQNICSPRASDKNEARREFIFNLLLISSFYLVFLSFVLVLINILFHKFLFSTPFEGIPLILLLFPLAFFILLFIVSKRGKKNLASYLFIFTLWVLCAYGTIKWGVFLYQTLLTFALIIILAGVIINEKFALLITTLTSVFLIYVTFLQQQYLLKFDNSWLSEPADLGNALTISFTLFIIALVSWLSNRELEHALQRAQESERTLKQERDLLEFKVQQRTAELHKAQADRLMQWYRFVEVGRLAAETFHDIKSPLTTAALNLEEATLLSEAKTDQTNHQITRKLTDALQNLHQITDFIQASHHQIQKQETTERFVPAKVVREAIIVMKPKAKNHQVAITSRLDRNIILKGNPLKFMQIVTNLISNAIDSYTSAHTDRIVKITLQRQEVSLVLTIQDWGKGINKQVAQRIFEPLFTTKPVAEGMGLGLAVVKTAVEKGFSGTIVFSTRPNRGTTFIISIPYG